MAKPYTDEEIEMTRRMLAEAEERDEADQWAGSVVEGLLATIDCLKTARAEYDLSERVGRVERILKAHAMFYEGKP